MNGLSKVSPKISRFYLDKGNQIILAAQISNTFIPIMSDSAMAVQELHDLLMQDYTVSEEKKALLCRDYPYKDNRTKGLFMAELICFGMEREFVNRDIRMKNLLASGNLSPAVSDYIFDEGVPCPCRNFCGRDQELTEIHDLLIDYNKVFLHGIPGIGKSELAKAYAKIHKKDYTNILYLTYSGNLKKDITDLDFADDQSASSEDERFRKHNRFLRALKDDSLIIIDNFNTASARDEFLPIVLKYRCRILFTTRSTLPGQTCFLVIKKLQNTSPSNTIDDKALLLDNQAAMEKDPKKAARLLQEAIALLPKVNSGNALLVSNLQANLGGMYRLTGNYVLAKQYMESAIQILNQYDLIGYHDSYVQTVNYAILLNDMGYPRQGLTGLQKIEPVVRKQNPLSLEYATIQQSMGYLNLSCGDMSKALECFQRALAIFAKIYENEPELLAEKKAEIAPVLQMAKLPPMVLPMLNG